MILIENLTEDARQIHHITLDDGSTVDITLIYLPAIQRWQFDIIHPQLTCYGRLLSNHPNLLRQWRRIIPFGLACIVTDGTEPFDINDFIYGRVELYILTADEVSAVETDIIGAAA